MAAVSRTLRKLVIDRAHGLCEYCQTQQSIVIEMELDHIVPTSAGGETNEANLCLACVSCNSHKAAYQLGSDPETARSTLLFNPRTQNWNDHFRWNDNGTHLIGLTDIGRATIERLKINRAINVGARALWVEAGWHPPKQ